MKFKKIIILSSLLSSIGFTSLFFSNSSHHNLNQSNSIETTTKNEKNDGEVIQVKGAPASLIADPNATGTFDFEYENSSSINSFNVTITKTTDFTTDALEFNNNGIFKYARSGGVEQTYIVTKIANDAFAESTTHGLSKKLFIPRSIEYIGESAFSGCSNLTKIDFDINDAISEIKPHTFDSCTSLRECNIFEVTAPLENLNRISEYAFNNCPLLGDGEANYFCLPEKVNYIGDYAFCKDASIKGTINFKQNVKYIGKLAFYGTSFETIYLSNSNKTSDISIGLFAFANNKKLIDFHFATLAIPGTFEVLNTTKNTNNHKISNYLISYVEDDSDVDPEKWTIEVNSKTSVMFDLIGSNSRNEIIYNWEIQDLYSLDDNPVPTGDNKVPYILNIKNAESQIFVKTEKIKFDETTPILENINIDVNNEITPTPSLAGHLIDDSGATINFNYLFYIDGILPKGLEFNQQTGVISGKPTQTIKPTSYRIYGRYYSAHCQLPNDLTITIKGDNILKINESIDKISYKETIQISANYYTNDELRKDIEINWSYSDLFERIELNPLTTKSTEICHVSAIDIGGYENYDYCFIIADNDNSIDFIKIKISNQMYNNSWVWIMISILSIFILFSSIIVLIYYIKLRVKKTDDSDIIAKELAKDLKYNKPRKIDDNVDKIKSNYKDK